VESGPCGYFHVDKLFKQLRLWNTMAFHVNHTIDPFTDKIYKKALVQLNDFFGFEWKDKKL
jgi:hypothetical protein